MKLLSEGLTLVGLTGKARSGKDTMARVLVDGYGFVQVAFADALKLGSAKMLGMDPKAMYSGDREAILPDFGFSVRHFLQIMGTECVRKHFGDDFWIKSVARGIETLRVEDGHTRFVVSDVRFLNEATWVRLNGGTLVHIDRPFGEGIATPDHVSEKGVAFEEGDVALRNDKGVMDWLGKVDWWAKSYWPAK